MATPRPQDCLLGGGEMGALLRAFDWSRTPVGPVEGWPQSLRTAVSMMLESRFGTYIAWGPEFTQFYNDGYRPILGSTKHPAYGKSTRDTFAEIWPIIGPMFEGVMRGVAVGADDLMLPLDRHGFPEECYFILSYSPIRDETGGVGGVLVTVTESSGRVLAQRRLATLRDLAASAAASQTVAAAWQRSAGILAANPSDLPFAVLYELSPHQARLAGAAGVARGSRAAPESVALGADDAWNLAGVLAGDTPTLVSDVRERFGQLSGGPWPEAPHSAMVLPIRRPGVDRPYGVLIAGLSPRLLIDDSYREFLSMVAGHVGTGVANASAYEEEKRRAEALAEIDRAKTAFFSNVSHEFRTPLTLMLGPLQELAETSDPALRERLVGVHRNAQRLLKLVNSLLDFSRIEAGRIQARFEPVDLPRLTADLASAFRSASDRAGLRLEVDCPPLPEPIYLDRDMWEKIVLNLLSIAFKFTFEGTIAVRVRWTGAAAELTVSDTGIGIAADELPRVFERFHRVPGVRARTHEGTGIGLALVQELVRQHGGSIAVDSAPDRGTTFTLTVPAGRDHLPANRVGAGSDDARTALGAAPFVEEALRWLPDADVGVDTDRAEPVPLGGTPGRIVVADDNADMRDYLRRILSAQWQVTTVADGNAALRVVQTERPDLLVTDVMMPGLDGFGLLQAVRADPHTRGTRVIMLSARAGEEARVDGLQAGADDYIVKPFAARELVARVEAQLLRARIVAAEEDHRRRLADVFTYAPVAIAVLRGPTHVFELTNPPYRELIGHRDVLGRSVREAFPELEGQGVVELLDRVYASGQPFVGRAHPIRLRRTPDGELEDGYFDFVYQPTFDADGRVAGIAAVGYDVTELVTARHDAEAASRAKDEFLAMLGHELRNPLSPMLTALELIRLRGTEWHEREWAVIDRQVRHLIGLVNDLLDVSRIASGKIELERGRVNVADAVARAVELAGNMLQGRGHTLEVDVDPAAEVDADPRRLAQIFSNLLNNAGKYTPPGGRVGVRGRRDDGVVVVSVTDSGMGIAPELLSRVFDMFVQGKSSIDRAQGGLGLGLALVRSLVQLHGGSVDVHSDGVGRGSTFTVRLPLARSAAGPDVDRDAAGGDAAAPADMRVLVVDDNRDAAQLLGDLLRQDGHEVRLAFDGHEAIEAAAEFRPAVALLDIGLPRMDGYQVAARLRAMGNHVRLIALTGYGQTQDRERTRAAGFEAHLVKPVTLAHLREALAAGAAHSDA